MAAFSSGVRTCHSWPSADPEYLETLREVAYVRMKCRRSHSWRE
ncbi:hypothetical protein AB0392_60720 [Nonomuraea angiospora]